MSTFDEAIAFLSEKGVEFRQGDEYVGEPGKGRHSVPRNYITDIYIPFTAEEWIDLMSTEGKFLGSCCATISAARDILLKQLRGGRWIRTGELWEFMETIGHHDGFEYMLPKDHEHYSEFDEQDWRDHTPEEDPIYRLWQVWDKIKEHVTLKVPYTEPYKPESRYGKHPVHEALALAYSATHHLYWATSCFGKNREDDPAWMKQQKHARRQLTLARVTPALRTLFEHLDQFDLGDFEGFAVCKKDAPDDVLDNSMGQCIFHDEAEAQKMIDQWAKKDDEHEEDFGRNDIREKTTIRPVSVTVSHGLRFLDEATGE
jgi:hypothetical protein